MVTRRAALLGALLIGLAAFAAAAAPTAGRLEGRVRDQLNNGYAGLRVFAHREGDRIYYTTLTGADGSFAFDDVAPGTYTVATERPPGSPPGYVAVVEIGEGATERVEVRLDSAYAIPAGDRPWGRPVRAAGQTFLANGRSIVGASVRADSTAPLRLRIRSGGPTGPVISALLQADREADGLTHSVTWRAGTVATTPGKRYYLEVMTADGSPWSCLVSVRGDAYRNGNAYFDGQSYLDQDLSAAVHCDSAQHPATYLQWSAQEQGAWGEEIGQTFVATGDCLLAAACVARPERKDEPLVLTFTVHEDGRGGRQVGPAKSTVAAPDAEHVVSWLPGEVALDPGRRYYLRVTPAAGGRFFCCLTRDEYRYGHAVIDGTPQWGRDLAGWMLQWHPRK